MKTLFCKDIDSHLRSRKPRTDRSPLSIKQEQDVVFVPRRKKGKENLTDDVRSPPPTSRFRRRVAVPVAESPKRNDSSKRRSEATQRRVSEEALEPPAIKRRRTEENRKQSDLESAGQRRRRAEESSLQRKDDRRKRSNVSPPMPSKAKRTSPQVKSDVFLKPQEVPPKRKRGRPPKPKLEIKPEPPEKVEDQVTIGPPGNTVTRSGSSIPKFSFPASPRKYASPVRYIDGGRVKIWPAPPESNAARRLDLDIVATNSKAAKPHQRLYYHVKTNIPIEQGEVEAEEDYQWLTENSFLLIDDFVDLNQGEKAFMKLWNEHLFANPCYGDRMMVRILEMFVEKYGTRIARDKLYRNFVVHLCNLVDFQVIDRRTMYKMVCKQKTIMMKHRIEDATRVNTTTAMTEKISANSTANELNYNVDDETTKATDDTISKCDILHGMKKVFSVERTPSVGSENLHLYLESDTDDEPTLEPKAPPQRKKARVSVVLDHQTKMMEDKANSPGLSPAKSSDEETLYLSPARLLQLKNRGRRLRVPKMA